MALSKPYCTIAEVKTYIRDSSQSDSLYEDAINRASRYIEQYTRKDFWYHDHSSSPYRVHPLECMAQDIYLPFPIITLTEVRVSKADSDTASTADDALDVEGWFFAPAGSGLGERSIVRSNKSKVGESPFEDDKQAKRVELYGTFGFVVSGTTAPPTDSDFPEGIRRACTLIAGAWTGKNRREEVGLDGQKVSLLDTSVPKEALTLLDACKRQLI